MCLALAVVLAAACGASVQASAIQNGASSTRARVWDLGGKLSFAAIGAASGAPRASVDKVFESAKQLGASLGVDVPPIPELPLSKADANDKVLGYLLNDAGAPIAEKLGSTYGADHAALFEVAVKSNLLLLLYAPGEDIGPRIAEVLKRRAPDAKLPETLWRDVPAKIEAHAPYDDVKDAVVKMQGDVRQFLKTE
jgi:hypothetical protein